MKKISSYMLKYWYAYAFALICLLIQVGLDVLSPLITQSIIDDVIGLGNISILPSLILTIFLIGVGRAVFGYFKEFLFDKSGFTVGGNIRRDVFKHIQGLSVDYFDRTNTGEVMSRVKDDVDRLQNVAGFIGMLIIEVILHTVLIMISMFRLNKILFIFPAIFIPFCGFLAIVLEKKLNRVYEDISEENAQMNTVAQENLAGVRTVKAFAREKHEIKKFLSHNKKYYDLNMRQSNLWIKYNPIFQLITRLLPIISLVIGGFMVINEDITLGTLGAFVEYCGNVVWPMEMLGWLTNELAAAFASNQRLRKVYTEKTMIKDKKSPVILDKISGHITFDNVSLSIDNKKILDNISFDVPAGKTIGVMGATGTGKSSIINLLLRFYDVSDGSIKLDGTDIRELSLAQLRSSTSLVMQDVFLFSDTINENVKLGKKAIVKKHEVVQALDDAQATEFIDKMDEGYDTVIGERGVGLSGGQKQRISIARAFAKNTPILVLDDSTSALDMETENLIQQNLNALEGITKLIIAHRISAVRNADEILILEDGRISERGTHEELLAMKGYYYKTYMAQYGEFLNIA